MDKVVKEKVVNEKPIKDKPIKDKPIKDKSVPLNIPYNDICWKVSNGSKWC
jgi:hypothetical protein